jgi:hypothetical protein
MGHEFFRPTEDVLGSLDCIHRQGKQTVTRTLAVVLVVDQVTGAQVSAGQLVCYPVRVIVVIDRHVTGHLPLLRDGDPVEVNRVIVTEVPAG